ncbi:MAG: hypothetical protein GTO08_10980, partial [Deltaproteobacteria bacterium]|nr:hypothetical protein [Deltaproteobacteria bacterium]
MKVIRIVLLSLLVVGVVIFSGTSAQAAVGGTVHDIDAYTGPGGGSGTADTAMGGTCSYCHIPHGALGDRLWPSSPVVTGDAWKDTTVGNLCWSCHEGVT